MEGRPAPRGTATRYTATRPARDPATDPPFDDVHHRRDRHAVLGACAFFGDRDRALRRVNESFGFSYEPPSWSHPFGLDRLGRDVLSRVIVGARSVIEVAPAASLLGVTLGSMLGLIMGYFGGWTDNIIGRVLDAILAVPFIVFGILVLTALSARQGISVSSLKLIVVIGLAFMPIVARTVRSAVLVERDLDYVQAAKLRGERAPYIMLVEILPNVMGPIVVEATIRLGVRRLRGRDARVPRLRATAALARLGPPDRRAVRGHLARVVGGRLPGARDRLPRRRHQPDRRHRAAGARPVSAPLVDVAAPALALRDLESCIACAEEPRGRARHLAHRREAGELRPRRRVRLRQVDGGALDRPLPPSERHVVTRRDRGRRPQRAQAPGRGAAPLPARRGLDGLPEPRQRAQSRRCASAGRSRRSSRSAASTARERVRGRSPCSGRSISPTRNRCCAATRTSSPEGCSSASSSRWPSPRTRAAHPRRADDGLDATVEAEVLDLIGELQERYSPPSSSSATTSGSSGRRASASASSTRGSSSRKAPPRRSSRTRATRTPSACCAASPAAGSARTAASSTRSPASCRRSAPTCPAASTSTAARSRRRSAAPTSLRTTRSAPATRAAATSTSRRRSCRGPRRRLPRRAWSTRARRCRCSKVDDLAKTFHQDGHDIKALAGVSADAVARGDARAGRRVRERQDDVRPHPARDRRADCGHGRDRRKPDAAQARAALRGGRRRVADRVPEPGLGAQPAAHGAADAQADSREARASRGRAADGRAEELVESVRLPERTLSLAADRAVRRTEAARRDRPCVRRRPAPRRLRRADFGAGRLRSGRDPEPARRPADDEARRATCSSATTSASSAISRTGSRCSISDG